jgi:hypothetical protein
MKTLPIIASTGGNTAIILDYKTVVCKLQNPDDGGVAGPVNGCEDIVPYQERPFVCRKRTRSAFVQFINKSGILSEFNGFDQRLIQQALIPCAVFIRFSIDIDHSIYMPQTNDGRFLPG